MKKFLMLSLVLLSISCAKTDTEFVPVDVEVPGAPILIIPPDVSLSVLCPNLSGAHLSINLIRTNGFINVVVQDAKNGKYCTLAIDGDGTIQ